MTPEELKQIEQEFGKQAKSEIATAITTAEKRINEGFESVTKGLMTATQFEAFKAEALTPLNEKLSQLETASKAQGEKMSAILEKSTPNSKTIEEFVTELAPKIRDIKTAGHGFIEFSGKQLKAAGIQSVAGSIDAMDVTLSNPYAPGIGGEMLSIFDIARNPNFITNRVNLGRTNQFRMAWANELDNTGLGVPTLVAEGGLKPQIQHKFKIETSVAKKIAGWVEMTDEFDQDLPQFSTAVRRMLQNDVIRAWDDAIQLDLIAAARPYEITGLDDDIVNANYWDAALAMLAQVGFYNFIPNGFAINWLTNVVMKTLKSTGDGQYMTPPFAAELQALLVYANKMANKYGLAGDFNQFNVDVLRDFYLKIGYINDELIYNKFAIAGELRYHSYISDNRKKALVYDSLGRVAGVINGSANFS